jgi:thiamine kinase-like enzyme
MHHDTKLSNILFDKADKALCVIDLDTVMPGYFISDVGDMMRTYLPPVSEEEQDLSGISVRPEYFRAIVSGYLEGMEGNMTALEQDQFLFAGRFMIYMQAMRFLTDFLTGDPYYGARYPGHNLVRARNQIRLLQRFNESESLLRGELEALLPGVRR